MSERGTFVTSFLYDRQIYPILQEHLPKLAVRFLHRLGKINEFKAVPVWFAGQIKGSYSGEEADIMLQWIEEHLLPALPAEHGEFSIVIMPDAVGFAMPDAVRFAPRVWTFHNGQVSE